MSNLNSILDRIASRETALCGRDFLLTWTKTRAELEQVLDIAEALRLMRADNVDTRCFASGLAVSQFRDNSTRTRFSFSSAANLLGLAVQDLDEGKSQIAHGETVRETSVMISFLSDAIGIRDDMFLGAGHEYMVEVAGALDDACAAGVLPQRPAIVNLQCDRDHPTQSMADLQHLVHEFGSLENLRGKRIAMTWAYSPSYGKPLSVPQGIIGLMTRLGMDVVLAHPRGYDLIPDIVETAGRQAGESGGSFTQVASMAEAFEGADIVYPKSWAPYAVMQQRTT
ncbi:MAG TPA: knotted carbamoyltransferase YgeW, partial [Candidatus Krumholzibacteria bacterium]|nr:knotted carbamoyltransferase YgeW [Candidatus Krumholzibacteria bacterium]